MSHSAKALFNQLDHPSSIWLDSADPSLCRQMKVERATTNPSLVLKAASLNANLSLLNQAKEQFRILNPPLPFAEFLALSFALSFLENEVKTVALQLDCEAIAPPLTARVHFMRAFAKKRGFSPEQLLFKIAATDCGFKDCLELERQGICCLLTMCVSPEQALMAAKAQASYIAVYVKRYQQQYCRFNASNSSPSITGEADLQAGMQAGVQLVHHLSSLLQATQTKVMAASFSSLEEALSLEGCAVLTIPEPFYRAYQNAPTLVTTRDLPQEPASNLAAKFRAPLLAKAAAKATAKAVLEQSLAQFKQANLALDSMLSSPSPSNTYGF